MRSSLTLTTSIAIASVLALSATDASAQAKLTRSGGVLGTSLTFALDGAPFDLYALLPSTTTGPIPLAILDPLDPRSLDVGLDMLSTLVIGGMDGSGQGSVTFPLPAAPALSGVAIYTQMMTLPGAGTLVDEISNRVDFALGLKGDTHLSLGNLPIANVGFGSVLLDDGRVLLGGGAEDNGAGLTVATGNLRIFNPQTQAFEDLASSLTFGTVTPSATKLADGRVLFAGGLDAAGVVLGAASIFDPASGLTSAAANMPGPRAQHTATLLNDGRVFLCGGVKAVNTADPIAGLGDILKTSVIYNPANNTWSSAASLPLPRIGHAASLLPSGKVLLSGGLEIGNLFGIPLPSIVNTCRRFDPVGGSMQSTASFSGDRALHGQLTLSDGRVLVAGGADGDVLTQNFFSLATCSVYSEPTNSWSNVPNLQEVRSFPSLVEVAGRVHVISGVGTIDLSTLSGSPVASIASGDTTTFNWAPAGTMVYPRALSSSIAIEGGERIVTLGTGDNGVPSIDLSAEVYIP
jgi:hypothetical protein